MPASILRPLYCVLWFPALKDMAEYPPERKIPKPFSGRTYRPPIAFSANRPVVLYSAFP